MSRSSEVQARKPAARWLFISGLCASALTLLVLISFTLDIIENQGRGGPDATGGFQRFLREQEHHAASDDTPPIFPPVRFNAGATSDTPMVWLLGASSLYFPDPQGIAEATVEALRGAGRPVQLRSLATPGADSSYLFPYLRWTLNREPPPDLLFIYMGHNEENNSLTGTPDHPPMRRTMFWAWLFSGPFRGTWDANALEWNRRSSIRLWYPTLSAIGLWPDEELLLPWKDEIGQSFRRRLDDALQELREHDIPVVLQVPVGNNDWPVCGPQGRVSAQKTRVDATSDPLQRERERIALRDLDTCNASLRAGRAIRDAIRAFDDRPGVWVHDLEEDWLQSGRDMGSWAFSDAYHFNHEGHAFRIELTLRFLQRHPELWQLLAERRSDFALRKP